MKTNNATLTAIILALLIVSIGGCHKNTSYGIGKVKTKITCSGGSCDTTIYTYDNQNRISTVSNTSSGTQQYSYNGNTISISNYNGSGVAAICTLNTSGLVSSINTQPYGNSYSYDNNGHLISSMQDAPPAYDNYVILNGNTIATYWNQPIAFQGGGADTTFTTFLPDTDKRDCGMPFWGKGNLNLSNTDTSYSSSYYYGATSYTFSTDMHTYSFDNMHRVTTETVAGSASTTIYSFTYY